MDAMMAEGAADREPARDARLRQIAAAAGVPLETFFGAPGPRAPAELGELIRLWDSVADEAGRAEILACARVVAGRSKDRTPGPG
ncbi:hypothetical protein ACRAWG_02505 [Methylobacterium sp. P31]